MGALLFERNKHGSDREGKTFEYFAFDISSPRNRCLVWWAEHFGEVGVRNFEAEEREGEETEQKSKERQERECVCVRLQGTRERDKRELLKWLSLVKKRIECYLRAEC